MIVGHVREPTAGNGSAGLRGATVSEHPMTMYLLVHDAIRREAAALEVVAAELDVDDHEGAGTLAERVAWFHRATRVHEATEEGVLFPALEARYPALAEAYVFDHDHLGEHSFDVMTDHLAALARPEEGVDRRTPLTLVGRAAIALNEHLWLHIEKENELLVGRVREEMTIDEQVAVASGMGQAVPEDLRGELTAWMYRHQSMDDRETMLRVLSTTLPPPAFAGVVTALAAASPPDEWAALATRVPGLATP